jgi:hypothetical protein
MNSEQWAAAAGSQLIPQKNSFPPDFTTKQPQQI